MSKQVFLSPECSGATCPHGPGEGRYSQDTGRGEEGRDGGRRGNGQLPGTEWEAQAGIYLNLRLLLKARHRA